MTFSLPVVLTLASYYIFSAAVGAMSEPTLEQKDKLYGWLYRFLQTLAANAVQLERTRFLGFIPAASVPDPASPAAVVRANLKTESK